MKKKPLAFRLVVGLLVGAVLAGLGSAAAYAGHYADRALPGVTVLGEPVTGMTADEVAALLQSRLDGVMVHVSVDGQPADFSLADLGVHVDPQATAANALAPNAGLDARFGALFTPREIPLVVTVDEEKTRAVRDDLAAQVGVPPRDATVEVAEDGVSYSVVPGESGRTVDASALVDAATTAGETLTSQTVDLTSSEVGPAVSNETARTVADRANQFVNTEVTVTGKQGELYYPTPAEKIAWVSIETTAAGVPQPVLNAEAVTAWVSENAEYSNIAVVNGVRNVNERNEVVSTSREGVDGFTVNNIEAISEQVMASLNAGNPFVGEFSYDKVEPTYTTRLIAEGAQNLIYPAAPGEKWVDLNLGNNTVIAYEGATVVRGPMYIVPGQPGMETPTGQFAVYLKYQSQTMRGTNMDGTSYVAPDVPWVTYFTGSIAFHGAPWQSSFGWSGPGGSHGCVNMSVADAQWMHGWTDMGSVVVSHY